MKLTPVFLSLLACAALRAQTAAPVKNVILFIGDGMSIPQRMVADEFSKRTRKQGLLINSLERQSITTTWSANSFITDSAASGTAIACGEKTNNGRIGMDAEGKKNLVSVAEVARDTGRKVGIVTSVTINHATPAAFYGHNTSRGNYYQLGLDLVASNFNYFGGGGIAKFDKKDDPKYKGNIYELAEKAGYVVSNTSQTFNTIKPGMNKVLSFGNPDNALPYEIDVKEPHLRLADFTRQAIELLENPNGFFLMVEGGKIDWMCHANDAATSIREVLALDDAVRVAYEFYQKHPEDTLIVVTGDHETGGLTLGFAGTKYKFFIENLAAQTCSRDTMDKKFKSLKGKTFEDAKAMITEVSGLVFGQAKEHKEGDLLLTEVEEETLQKAFAKLQDTPDSKNPGRALTSAVITLIDNKSAVAWTSGAHTALPVATTSVGARSIEFTNIFDNVEVSRRIKQILQ
ncbi:MAG: alkaline phosphatase [Victivallales bacterium]|nr:alkaline phosphatase [Victivallales bacterium]